VWWKGRNQAKQKQERASNGSSVNYWFVLELALLEDQFYVELQFCLTKELSEIRLFGLVFIL
jgi:hypothetical protein